MRDYIKEQAIDFQNRHYFGYTAAIHVEDADDQAFWDDILQRVKPGNYDYIYYSKSKDGNDTRGCEQCLLFKPYLGPKFFICMDSDMRYLLQEDGFNADHFIYQTYTYSWENHRCEATSLQKRFTNRCPQAAAIFDFRIFLSELSQIIYEPLLALTASLQCGNRAFSIAEFRKCMPKQCSTEEIENNGSALLKRIKNNFAACLTEEVKASLNLSDAKRYSMGLNVNIDNAYLHVRGHNIYDMVKNIGRFLCRPYQVNFERDILNVPFDDENHWELIAIMEDLS